MKPRIVALMLLASMLLLVSLIPAAGAQSAGDHPPTPVAPVPDTRPQPHPGQPGPAPSAPNAFTVSGKVTDISSQPVADVELDAYNTTTWDYYTTTTNASGDYSFSLPAGDYDIYPWKNHWLFKPEVIQVTVGSNETNKDFEAVDASWQVAWYNALEDAYTNEGSKTTNYGSASILRVKNAKTDMNAYAKFDVQGFSSGTGPGTCYGFGDGWLTTYVKEPGTDGGGVYPVGNNWNETTINWNNAPAITGDPIGRFGAVTDETSAWARLSKPANGDGVYSFAIRNESSNSVDYSSWEGGNYPWLIVDYRVEYKDFLRAEFYSGDRAGLAPITVQFTDQAYGCATSWHWDFGDGATSTQRNPSHTYTSSGYYEVVLTVTNSEGQDRKTQWVDVVEPPSLFYLSLSKKYQIGGLTIEPNDIVLYDRNTDTWTMVYDGSAHGTNTNIGSFAWDGDDLLLVFSGNQTIPGLGKATQYDVVHFSPNDPGIFPLGSGTFDWEFRGKDYDLTKGTEKIDALNVNWALLGFSTTGTATVSSIKAADEDLLGWFGSFGYGRHFDGSTIPGMAAEDINGFWYDTWTDDYYVTILGKFNLGGVAGNDASIVRLTWNGSGYTPSLVDWLAPGAATFKGKIDGLEMGR